MMDVKGGINPDKICFYVFTYLCYDLIMDMLVGWENFLNSRFKALHLMR